MVAPVPSSLSSSSGVGGGDMVRGGTALNQGDQFYFDGGAQATATRPWWMGGLDADFGNRIASAGGGASGWALMGLAAVAAGALVYAATR